jgi:hypothetical protein
MATFVYFMCAMTSALCASLLFINFRRSGVRLLFWASACFFGLTANNILLFVDRIIVPSTDMSVFRTLPAVVGFGVLLWGFIWDTP